MANSNNRRPDLNNDVLADEIRSGKTLEQIGILYGCSPATVRNRMIKMGVALPPLGATKGYPLKYGGDRQGKVKAWRIRNPERTKMMYRAHYQVRMALRRGELTRPDVCDNCSIPDKKGKPPQAAHIDYSRPLDVRWLCSNCHMIYDHDDPKTKRNGEADHADVHSPAASTGHAEPSASASPAPRT